MRQDLAQQMLTWAHSGPGIDLEISVAVPARLGEVGAAPREGGH